MVYCSDFSAREPKANDNIRLRTGSVFACKFSRTFSSVTKAMNLARRVSRSTLAVACRRQT